MRSLWARGRPPSIAAAAAHLWRGCGQRGIGPTPLRLHGHARVAVTGLP
ncbi:MAG: hypothetical protein Q8S73_42720 [Deltaproteobacteria bacterium]|nr:hypothetical protein [Myxococcales bacterium]MDP3220876.1 hypothetical protein [Deltaproteobacteria bacterium]